MPKQLKLNIGQSSSAGIKPVNQDFHGALVPNDYQINTKGISVCLADGISSSKVSQIASETAVKTFLQDYYSTSESWSVQTSGHKVLTAINSWLYAQTQKTHLRFDRDKGYVCTFSCIVFKSLQAHIFHSGDSRIYRIAGNRLEQLTTDHKRVVNEETSYLTHALGIFDKLDFQYRNIDVGTGDIFILATDGVFEFLTEKEILNHLSTVDSCTAINLNDIAQRLTDAALNAGSDDNLTIQIVKVDSLPEPQLTDLHQQAIVLPPAPRLHARQTFDGFNILKEIYISSRSHVFLAQDIETGKLAVIKTPSTELHANEANLENLLMEEWIAKKLNSAHLMKAMEFNRGKNCLYTITEYIEGKSLNQWMIDNPEPDIDTVRNIIKQIAKGLQAMHRQEMVHQDLRPHNIMLDKNGVVKIIDFGAVKVAGVNEFISTNEGLVGTAQYSAPEYFLGQAGSRQSDMFSLGVITYQMLSGKLPYGTAIAKCHNRHALQKLSYTPLKSHDIEIPGWLDYAIGKAVNIDPTKRYQELSEFIYELKHPNANYLKKAKAPLLERNPVLVWQSISFILLCLVFWQGFTS